MVNLGSIWWSVQVANAAEAASKAERMQEELEQTSEKAEQANDAINATGEELGEYEQTSVAAGRAAEQQAGATGMLASGMRLFTDVVIAGSAALLTYLGLSKSAAGATWVLNKSIKAIRKVTPYLVEFGRRGRQALGSLFEYLQNKGLHKFMMGTLEGMEKVSDYVGVSIERARIRMMAELHHLKAAWNTFKLDDRSGDFDLVGPFLALGNAVDWVRNRFEMWRGDQQAVQENLTEAADRAHRLQQGLEGFDEVSDTLEQTSEATDKVSESVADLAHYPLINKFESAGEKARNLSDALGDLNDNERGTVHISGLLIGAFTALSATSQAVQEKFAGLSGWLTDTRERLQGFLDAGNRAEEGMELLDADIGFVTTGLYFMNQALEKTQGLLDGLGGDTGLDGVKSVLAKVSGMVGGGALAGGLGGGLVSGGIGGMLGGLGSRLSGALAGALSGTSGMILGGLAGVGLGLGGVKLMEKLGISKAIKDGAKWLGKTMPEWVTDAIITGFGIFEPVAVLGGFINGFMDDVFKQPLKQSVKDGLKRAEQVAKQYDDAWSDTIARLKGHWKNFKKWMGNKMGGLKGFFKGLGQDAASAFENAWNSTIPNQLNIPQVKIGGGTVMGQKIPSVSIGGGSISLPQLASGGMIESGGLAMLHEGEAVMPADVTRDITQVTEAAQGGGDGGVQIGEVSIEIGDQSLDMSRLSPGEVRRLAKEIAPELGREVEKHI